MDEKKKEGTDERKEGRGKGGTEGRKERRKEGWEDGRMEGWKEGTCPRTSKLHPGLSNIVVSAS